MLMPISAFLIGLAVGLRHNVFILIPAGVVAAAVALCIGIAANDSFFAIVLVVISTTAALQIGYLAGIVISSGVRHDLVSAPEVPIANAYGRTDVVHFHQYRLAKTQ
jgi:hypothetical protein